MASKVSICNFALSRLGVSSITSLTDNTVEAKACNLIYDDIADEVMVEGEWSSTIVRATLAQTTNTPTYEFTYEYQLPVSPLTLKVLSLDEFPPGSNDYKIEGDKLLTDLTAVNIRYIGRITDTQQYGVLLQRAIVARLALELNYSLTSDKGLTQQLEAQYERVLDRNLTSDNVQGSKDIVSTPDLDEVR